MIEYNAEAFKLLGIAPEFFYMMSCSVANGLYYIFKESFEKVEMWRE